MKEFLIFIMLFMCAAYFVGKHGAEKSPEEAGLIDQPITQEERATIMLHICFPGGNYKADAAPDCPQFKSWLTKQLNKNERK
jgi:hypothetical protein